MKRESKQVKPLSVREMVKGCMQEQVKFWPHGLDLETDFIAMHTFVETLRHSKEKAFIEVEKNGHLMFKRGRFATHSELGRSLTPQLRSRFQFSPQIRELLAARDLFSIPDFECDPNEEIRGKPMGERLNLVVERVREKCTGKVFLDDIHNRRVNVLRNCASADAVIADISSRIRRPFVARFELAYEGELHNQLFERPDYLRGHLRHFFNNWRRHEGYIWKIGYGSISGYHAHVVMFFNGDKISWRDEYRAICAHWRRTTGTNAGLIIDWAGDRKGILGDGSGYWDVGMKVAKKKELRKALYYLIQKDEYFRPAYLFRTFGATEVREGKPTVASSSGPQRSLKALRIGVP